MAGLPTSLHPSPTPTELQESTSAIRFSLEAVYSDMIMNTTSYHLHTVLVHQGQASGGHYWAYIRKNPRTDYHEELSCELEPVDIRVEQNKAVQNGGRGTGPCDAASGRGTGPCDAASERGTGPCDAAGGRGTRPCDASGCGTGPSDAGGRGTGPCDAAGGRGSEPHGAIGGHGTWPCDAGGHDNESQGLIHDGQSEPILTECQVTELVVTDITPLTSLESSQASLETDSKSAGSLSEGSGSSPPPAILIVNEPSECGVPRVPDEGGVGRSERMEVGEGEDVWLKFNDVSVSEVKWEEVERESYGGKQNTSAYCLVYINDALWKQWEESGEGVSVCVCVRALPLPATPLAPQFINRCLPSPPPPFLPPSLLPSLPLLPFSLLSPSSLPLHPVTPPPLSAALEQFVSADNAHFRTEMVKYRSKQKTITRAKQVPLTTYCYAVYLSILQYTSVYYSIPQDIIGYHSIPQYTTVYHSIPQDITVYLSILQYTSGYYRIL